MGKTKLKTIEETLETPPSDSAEPASITPAAESEDVLEDVALSEDVKADTTEEKKTEKKAKGKKPKKGQKVRSKKYQEVAEKVEKTKGYSLSEAIDLVKEVSYSKFDGSVEIHLNTNSKNVRGLIALPFLSGKKLKIAALGKGAADSGADIVGDDQILEDVGKGKVNFDVLITTPDIMPKLARMAKVLGPKGLMPNPKNGTISQDLKKTVTELQGGKIEYKTESKANVIHLGVGKVNQDKEELYQNIKTLLTAIGKTKISKAVLSPTMGPAVRIDLANI